MKSQQAVDMTWSILDRLGISLAGDAFNVQGKLLFSN